MRRAAYGWALLAVAVGGCGGEVRVDIPDPADGAGPPEPNAGFAVYVQAAQEMEQRAEKVIGRTSWSPDQQDAMIAAAAAPLAKVAGLDGVEFGRTSQEPMGLREHSRGWRAMGRALAWQIDKQVRAGEGAKAIASFTTALRMADGFASSDAEDADMGAQILNECITAIWPGLPRFGAGELRGLSDRIAEFVESSPDARRAADQELFTMLQGASWVADLYERRDFVAMGDRLGRFADPAVKYLRELTKEDTAQQTAFFEGLTKELRAEADAMFERLTTAPHTWQEIKHSGDRPWWRFTDAFGTTWRRYVDRRAAVRTRLRVLALDAALLSQFKASGSVPRSLGDFAPSLRIDPYSGSDFVYVPRGVDYKLYSVGPNLREDAGSGDDISVGR